MVGRKKRSHSVGRVLYINRWWFQPRAWKCSFLNHHSWSWKHCVWRYGTWLYSNYCIVFVSHWLDLSDSLLQTTKNIKGTKKNKGLTMVFVRSDASATHLPMWIRCKIGRNIYICSTLLHPASLPSAKPALRTPTLAMSFSAATQQTVSFWLWSVLSCKVRSGAARRQRTKYKSRNNANKTASCKLFCCVLGWTWHIIRLASWDFENTVITGILIISILSGSWPSISSILQKSIEIWLDWNLLWALVTHLEYTKTPYRIG